MGIIKRGILGGFSGRIGNVVGSSWKGLAVVKSLPLSVANPRTTAQTTQRSKFSNCVDFASLLLTDIIKPLWDRNAVHMSGFNAFCKANIALMPEGAAPDLTGLIISEGPLGEIPSQTATLAGDRLSLALAWDGVPSGAYQAANDKILAFAYVPDDDMIVFDDGTKVRSDEAMTLTFPDAVREGNDVYYGIVALSPDGFKPGAELSKKVG